MTVDFIEDNFIIFPVYCGDNKMNNNNHLHNHLKYLFSLSSNHSTNELTYANYYRVNELKELGNLTFKNIISEGLVLDENKKLLGNVLNLHKNYLKEYNKLFSRIFYLGFVVKKKNGQVITNMIEKLDDNSFGLSFTKEMLETYLQQNRLSKDKFFTDFNDVISDVNMEDIIYFNKLSDKELLFDLQKILLDNLSFDYINYDKTNKIDTLLSISHIDQPEHFFHVHQLCINF